MTSSPDLFNIIKSLTPSEKRYFKIYASRHVIGSKNNYEKLYDALDALPDDKPYDEAAFKKAMKGKSWIKNLAVEKNQLEDLLLKAMRNYHSEKTEEGKLDNAIANIRFLYDKGLIDTVSKMLEGGIKLAKEQYNLTALITLQNYYALVSGRSRLSTAHDTQEKILSDEMGTYRMLDVERKANQLNRKVYHLYNEGKLINQPETTKKLLTEIKNIQTIGFLTPTAEEDLLKATAMIYEKEKRFEEAKNLYQKAIYLLQARKTKTNAHTTTLRLLLYNYLACVHNLEQFNEFPPIIAAIEMLPTSNFREQAEVFRSSKQFRLLYYLNTPEESGSQALVDEIEKGLIKYKAFCLPKTVVNFRINICFLYLKQLNFQKLTDAINKFYDLVGREPNFNQVVRDIKIIEVIAQIHLKKYDLADYQLTNLDRWLRATKLNNDFTAQLLRKIKQMAMPDSEKKISGQLNDVNCPPDMKMLKEILVNYKL